VGTTTVSLYFPGSLFRQIVARVVIESYVCALARENVAERSAYAARPARDKSPFPLKQETQTVFFSQKCPPQETVKLRRKS
jgi:hypothetical protein